VWINNNCPKIEDLKSISNIKGQISGNHLQQKKNENLVPFSPFLI